MKRILFLILLLVSFTIAQPKRTMLETGNSSTTVLDSAATFTGEIRNALSLGNWTSMSVSAFANHSSGVNGTLTIRQSADGTNWALSESYTIATNTEYNYQVLLKYRYFQVVFVNGAEVQTAFRLETIMYEEDVSLSGAVDSTLIIANDTWDSSLGANKAVDLNAVQYHYTAPVASLTSSNLDTDSTQIVVSLQSYRHFSLHCLASGGVTYKVFISNIEGASATNPYDGNWIDYSTTLLGGATVVDTDGFYIQDTVLPALKIMIKIWTTDATNDFSATLVKSF